MNKPFRQVLLAKRLIRIARWRAMHSNTTMQTLIVEHTQE